MIYFIGCTHWDFESTIRICNRPFSDVGEMNEALIDNINELVKPNDTLYHLGDFGKGSNWRAKQWRDLINCSDVRLILGNHDYQNFNVNTLKDIFQWVGDYKEIKHNNLNYILFHYPIQDWQGKWRDTPFRMLHSHSHGKQNNEGLYRVDVGVDVWDYKPVSIEQLEEHFANVL